MFRKLGRPTNDFKGYTLRVRMSKRDLQKLDSLCETYSFKSRSEFIRYHVNNIYRNTNIHLPIDEFLEKIYK